MRPIKALQGKEIHVILDEALVTVFPTLPQLEKKLKFRRKFMERGARGEMSVRTKVEQLYWPHPNHTGAILCFQGAWKIICDLLKAFGCKVKFHDSRQPFPAPKLNLMFGFRGSQGELITQAMNRDMSGLVGAPTRYGKTTLIINWLRAFPGVKRVLVLPGEELLDEMFPKVQAAFPHTKVVMLGGKSRAKFQGEEITVCSMDSMHKLTTGSNDLVLIDEPHQLVTEKRLNVFLSVFEKARRIGFGATLDGRFDGTDVLIEAAIGPVLACKTYKEAVAEGMVAQITAFMIRVPFPPPVSLKRRDIVYRLLLYQNPKIGAYLQWLLSEVIPKDWQTIMFIKNEESADFYLNFAGQEGTIAMAKKLTDKEREDLKARMVRDEIKRCLASIIYATGVTFNELRVVINLEGGGAYTGNIQKPGRVAEVRPGKKRGVLFDFFLVPTGKEASIRGHWNSLVGEGMSRKRRYEATGYEVIQIDIEDRETMKLAFNAICVQ